MPARRKVSETIPIAVPDIRASEFCAVCCLIFGSHETRISVGEKVAHPHCARWLSESKVA